MLSELRMEKTQAVEAHPRASVIATFACTHAYELTRSIVARGISYAILVQRLANKLSYEGLPILEKEIEPPVPTCPVILGRPRDGRLSPRVSALAELARRQYPRTSASPTLRR